MKIPEQLKKLLNEEQLKAIKDEFDKQVELVSETKLKMFEEETIKALDNLEKQINEFHTIKFARVIDSRKANEKERMEKVKNYYENKLMVEAREFKSKLANNVQNFINKKIDNITSFDVIKEAARNKAAYTVVSSLRKQLAIDSELMKKEVATPIIEARERLNKQIKYIKKLKQDNILLSESLQNSERNLLIEQKIKSLPSKTAAHMNRILEDKDIKFINENFDHLLEIYNENVNNKRNELASSAMKNHKNKNNRVSEPKKRSDLIIENTEQIVNEDISYVDDINSYYQELFPEIK